MAIKKKNKKEIVDKFKDHPNDTGSASVQVALLTERITYLTGHMQKNKKDFHSRRGLLLLVGRRRHLLNYLKDNDYERYSEVVKELNLVKK